MTHKKLTEYPPMFLHVKQPNGTMATETKPSDHVIPAPVASAADAVIAAGKYYIEQEIALGHCTGEVNHCECVDNCEHYEICEALAKLQEVTKDE